MFLTEENYYLRVEVGVAKPWQPMVCSRVNLGANVVEVLKPIHPPRLTHSQIPKGDGRNRWWSRPQFPMKNTRTRANGAPSRVTCSEVGPLNHMRISQTNMVRNLRNIWFDGGTHVARLSHLLGMISMVLM